MPSRQVKYTISPSEEDRIFIDFKTSGGKITYFVIQYHCKTPNGWRTVRRYDTAHGYAHKEIYAYGKKRKLRTMALGGDYNQIFTEAQKEITRNFKKIKEDYMFQ